MFPHLSENSNAKNKEQNNGHKATLNGKGRVNHKCCEELLAKGKSYQWKIEALKSVAAQRRKEKRYKEADEIYQSISLLRDSVAMQEKRDMIRDTQVAFDNEVIKRDAEQQTNWWKTAASKMFKVAFALFVLYLIVVRSVKKGVKKLKKREADYEKTINSNNRKIDALTKKGKANMEKIAKMKRQMKSLEKRNADKERKLKAQIGQNLWKELEEGGNIVQWSSEDCACLLEYYRTIDGGFVNHVENDYTQLSDSQLVYLLLERSGKDVAQICNALNMQASSLRSLKSRLSKNAQ